LEKTKNDKKILTGESKDSIDTDNQAWNNLDKKAIGNISKTISRINLRIEPKITYNYYYYKRWVWMNFPIICMLNNNKSFSWIINRCFRNHRSVLEYSEDKNL
jgi:hypothetical protein